MTSIIDEMSLSLYLVLASFYYLGFVLLPNLGVKILKKEQFINKYKYYYFVALFSIFFLWPAIMLKPLGILGYPTNRNLSFTSYEPVFSKQIKPFLPNDVSIEYKEKGSSFLTFGKLRVTAVTAKNVYFQNEETINGQKLNIVMSFSRKGVMVLY